MSDSSIPASDMVLVVTVLGGFVAIVGAVCVRIITAQATKIHTAVDDIKVKTETIEHHVNGTATAMQAELKALRSELAQSLLTASEFKQLAAALAAKEK